MGSKKLGAESDTLIVTETFTKDGRSLELQQSDAAPCFRLSKLPELSRA